MGVSEVQTLRMNSSRGRRLLHDPGNPENISSAQLDNSGAEVKRIGVVVNFEFSMQVFI